MNLKRKLVAAAFRSMAGGVDEKTAYASTVAYYHVKFGVRAPNLLTHSWIRFGL